MDTSIDLCLWIEEFHRHQQRRTALQNSIHSWKHRSASAGNGQKQVKCSLYGRLDFYAGEKRISSDSGSPVIPESQHRRSTTPCPDQERRTRLEHQSRTLRLLVTTGVIGQYGLHHLRQDLGHNVPKLEVLASLQRQLVLGLARSALQSQHDLLGRLGLLVEHGLRLTTITGLLAVVTALTLGEKGSLWRSEEVSIGWPQAKSTRR
jgi:hypothetical protein